MEIKRRHHDFIEQRNLEMRTLYRQLATGPEGKEHTLAQLWEIVAESCSSRCYISEEAAIRQLRAIDSGRLKPTGGSRNRAMMWLYGLYGRERQLQPALTIVDFVRSRLNSPAPAFFIKGQSARLAVMRTCSRLGLSV